MEHEGKKYTPAIGWMIIRAEPLGLMGGTIIAPLASTGPTGIVTEKHRMFVVEASEGYYRDGVLMPCLYKPGDEVYPVPGMQAMSIPDWPEKIKLVAIEGIACGSRKTESTH